MDLVTVKEAAELTGWSSKTIRRRIKNRNLGVRVGWSILIPKDQLPKLKIKKVSDD